MGTGGRDKPARPRGPGVKEAAPGGTLAAGHDETVAASAAQGAGRVPEGADGGREGTVGRVPEGAAGRVRRPADLLFAVLSLAVVAVVLGSIRALPLGSTELADDVSAWVHHIPRWLSFAAEVVSGVGCFALAVVALVVLVRGQWQDLRNAAAAGFTGAAAAVAAAAVWRAEHGTVQHAVLHGSNPSIFVVDTAFVAFVVGTDLTRRSHWSRWSLSAVMALLISGLAVGTLTPFAVVIVFFGGVSVGWLVRWLLGAASVLPGRAELVAWLRSQGAAVRELAAGRRARLDGTLDDGTRIQVRLYGRDTRGSGLARRLWALARLRPAVAGHIAISSRAQLEQLALACTLARQASVPCPTVLLFGQMPGETLVLVMAVPAGDPPGSAVTVQDAASLFASLRALHRAGIAHRDLRAENLFVSESSAGFRSLDGAVPAASELARRLDLAQALATLAPAVGPPGAIRALREGYGAIDNRAVAAVLQPAALAPWGWRAMRASQACLNEVRSELLGPGASVPAVRLERFRLRTVASAVALTVAAYLLIGEFSGADILGTLGRANLGWFAVAILGSAVTYLAAAVNLAAFVPKRLSIIRGFGVQLSTAFVGLAMPPTVGHVAVNARYLHGQDVDEGSIAAAVTMSQVVNVVTTVLLLIIFGLLTGSGLSRFKIAPGTDVLIGLAAIAAVIIILVAVPQTRARLAEIVWPHLRSVGPRLVDAISRPLRLAISAGANLVLTAAYLVAFIAALRAVGVHPPLLPVAVVYLAGNAVGSAAPTPGGIGGVEAVLAAGLTAIGIPAHDAIPAVLLFRVATFWLPIPAGWVAYLLLRRRGVL
jgi:glycosyltransferase 2 family protein